MKINDYIAGLLPSFEKNRIIGSIANTRKTTQDVIRVYTNAVESMRASTFTAKPFALLNDEMRKEKELKMKGKDTQQEVILKVLEGMPAIYDMLDELAEENFHNTVTAASMNYARVNILRLVELANFFTRYAVRLISYESLTMLIQSDKGVEVNDKAFERDREWLMRNQNGFIAACVIFGMGAKDLKTKIQAIPDISASAGTHKEAVAAFGAKKIDPLQMGFISYKLNPIYHIRMAWLDYQERRLEETKEELTLTELTLTSLRNEAGTNRKELGKQIEFYENRVVKLRKKIRELEEA